MFSDGAGSSPDLALCREPSSGLNVHTNMKPRSHSRKGWRGRLLPLAFRIIVTGLALGIIFLAACLWEWHRPLTLPAPTGPHSIGQAIYTWQDNSREASLGGANRKLIVVVWYPAQSIKEGQPVPYLPPLLAQVAQQGRDPLGQRLDLIQVHAIAGAPVALEKMSYPVLIFSPGLGQQPTFYTVLAEELASQGYVVAGIVPNGTPIAAQPEDIDDKRVMIWSADILFVIGRLEKLNSDAASTFGRHLDMDRVGVFGHSFGGAASIQACSTDSRCKAAVDLDGSVYGSVLNDGAQRPIMFLMGDPVLMPNLPGFRGSRERTERAMARDNRTIGNILNRSPEGYKFRVHGLWHKDYTDFALFFDPPSKVARIVGNEIDGQRGLRIVTTYLRQFFDKSLSGARAPLIDDGNTPYTEVQVEYVAHR